MKQKLTIEVDIPEGYETYGSILPDHYFNRSDYTQDNGVTQFAGAVKIRRTHKTLKASNAPGLKPGVWIAKDACGTWFVYAKKATKGPSGWSRSGGNFGMLEAECFSNLPDCHWEDSLHQITE